MATRVDMKALLLVVLAACTAPTIPSPDAFQWETPGPDALHLDPPPRHEGCNDMGNIPSDRTVTLGTDDPVPSALLNELQDASKGHWRKPWTRRFSPVFLFQSGGANGFVPAVNPAGGSRPSVFQNNASTTSNIEAGTWDEGDRIIGASMEIYGNGNNFTFQALYTTDQNTAMFTMGSETMLAVSAAWHTITISVFTPRVLLSTDIVRLQVLLNGGAACIGDISLLYDRLP